MKNASRRVVLCNGANLPESFEFIPSIGLEYRESVSSSPNVKLALPNFVLGVFHLPDRILDLLEIATYVYCTDRLVSRGGKDNLERHSWSRLFDFIIKVRDFDFWNTPTVKDKLKDALVFMSGDQEYDFTFEPDHSTDPTGPFDKKTFQIERHPDKKVILFSGGLDSLAGIVDHLENSSDRMCLVSHRSGQPKTAKTQDQLIRILDVRYPDRIEHYKFDCSLRGIRAREETQRTRAFLYTSIAYALSHALSPVSQREIFVYENGVTSINFPKQQDQMNARASRTTHPKTIGLLEAFFSEVDESKIKITTPFLWKTKTDIFRILSDVGQQDLITSTVSCSQTFKNRDQATHCGGCSQCIDRRFAAYGSGLDDEDEGGIYGLDFIRAEIGNNEIKTTLIDYVVQAKDFALLNSRDFYFQMLNELADLTDYIHGTSEEEKIRKVWELCNRHGKQVLYAIRQMRDIHDDPYYPLQENSFLQVIAKREHLMYSEPQPDGIEIFYSYSHVDEELRNQLESHLAILRRNGVITDWHDRKIGAGREWEGEIDTHLDTAHIILLLISADFIASDYCYNVEMTRAMERHRAGDARVIPVILRSVDWRGALFGRLQALPQDAVPVTRWEDRDEAFTNIAEGIREVIEQLNQT